MNQKTSLGVTIFGWLAIILGAVSFLFNLRTTFIYLKEEGIFITLITFLIFCNIANVLQIIYGIGVLQLREWARKMAIIMSIVVLIIYPLLYLIFGIVLTYKNLIVMMITLGFPIAIIYFFTRPRVKAQFK